MKVLISEWAQEAAHNLDTTRDTWLSRIAASDFVEPQLQKLKVDSRLDHSAVLAGTYHEIKNLYEDVSSDVIAIELCLSRINVEKTIDGRRYPRYVFEAYRLRLLGELAYKKTLLTVTKEELLFQRMLGNHRTENNLAVAGGETNDLDLLERLFGILRANMQKAHDQDWFSALRAEDQSFVEYLGEDIKRRRQANKLILAMVSVGK